MPSVSELIAAINPDEYCDYGGDIKRLTEIKEKVKKEGVISAAKKILPKPLAEHKIVYESSTETLEPLYFWILDFMRDVGLTVEKLTDSFVSSPGSGHFSELGQKSSIMQQQGMKIMGDVNTVLRSVLNLIYDLKEFKIRLKQYDDLTSKDGDIKSAAILSLKQVWMDKVDISKGNSSIKAMAFGTAGYQTLIDAFLIVKDESLKGSDGSVLDLNDRVLRILKARIHEFNVWVSESENELRKRYNLEREYLKSQVNSLKLYSRWVKPYLKAAQNLEMKDSGRNPALVNVFNTLFLERKKLGSIMFLGDWLTFQ